MPSPEDNPAKTLAAALTTLTAPLGNAAFGAVIKRPEYLAALREFDEAIQANNADRIKELGNGIYRMVKGWLTEEGE